MRVGCILVLVLLDASSEPCAPKELLGSLSRHSLIPLPMAETTFYVHIQQLLNEGFIKKVGLGERKKYALTKAGHEVLSERADAFLDTLISERSQHINAAYICDLSVALLKEGRLKPRG